MPSLRSAVQMVCAAIFSLIFFNPSAHAQFAPIPKEEMDITSVPGEPGASALVLFREQVDDDRKHLKTVYVRLKVLTEAGRKYADVEVPYGGSQWGVSEVKGRTTHADGSVVRFEGKPLDKLLVNSRQVKYWASVFSLPDVQPGSIIEYSYDIRFDRGMVMQPWWKLQDELFQKKIHYHYNPTGEDVILGHDQLSSYLAWIEHLPPKVTLTNDRIDGIDLVMTDVPPLFGEEMMPPEDFESYYIGFYYRAKAEPAKYWKDEGKFWSKDAEKFMGKTSLIESTLPQVLGTASTPEEKVRKIYAFINTLENTTFSFTQTPAPDKSRYKPSESVEDVLRKKSGDRDELTRLFVSMARSAGIPAYLMAVTDRTRAVFEQNMLLWRQLDSEIAIVTLGGKDLFVDPGTKYCPFGSVYWKFTASKGVRQLPDKTTALIETPVPQLGEAAIKRVGRFRLTDDGQLQGSLLLVRVGRDALAKRLQALNTDATGREKMLVEEVRTWLPANADVTLTRQPVWDDSEKPMIAEFKVSTPAVTAAGKRVLMPINILQVGQKPLLAHAERKHNLVFNYPTRDIDELHIVLPPSLSVEQMPAARALDPPFAIYRAERTIKNNEIVSTRDISAGLVFVPPDKYKEVKSFFDSAKQADEEQLVLRKTEPAVGN